MFRPVDLGDVKYDVLVFFSPSGIESLFKNFPDLQAKRALLLWSHHHQVEGAGLTVNISAPNPKAPSMSMAIDLYVRDIK